MLKSDPPCRRAGERYNIHRPRCRHGRPPQGRRQLLDHRRLRPQCRRRPHRRSRRWSAPMATPMSTSRRPADAAAMSQRRRRPGQRPAVRGFPEAARRGQRHQGADRRADQGCRGAEDIRTRKHHHGEGEHKAGRRGMTPRRHDVGEDGHDHGDVDPHAFQSIANAEDLREEHRRRLLHGRCRRLRRLQGQCRGLRRQARGGRGQEIKAADRSDPRREARRSSPRTTPSAISSMPTG